MFTKDGLLEFHRRAHQSIDQVIDLAAEMKDEDLFKSHSGFGKDSVMYSLLHIAGAEDFWVHQLLGREFIYWDIKQYKNIDDVRSVFNRVRSQTTEFISGASDDELISPRELSFNEHTFKTNPALVFHRVLLHAFHHKGQVIAMMKMMGYQVHDTDIDLNIQ